jgi:hypothetical protein
LGVHFDRLLHFGGHCKMLRQRVRPRLEQLRKITGRSWGLDETHIRSVAAGYVRGALEHSAGAWLPLLRALTCGCQTSGLWEPSCDWSMKSNLI